MTALAYVLAGAALTFLGFMLGFAAGVRMTDRYWEGTLGPSRRTTEADAEHMVALMADFTVTGDEWVHGGPGTPADSGTVH